MFQQTEASEKRHAAVVKSRMMAEVRDASLLEIPKCIFKSAKRASFVIFVFFFNLGFSHEKILLAQSSETGFGTLPRSWTDPYLEEGQKNVLLVKGNETFHVE